MKCQKLTNRVNLIGIKKVTETSKEKSFKKQESVGMMLEKVNKQDLEKERVTISKTKYPYISGFTKDMVLEMLIKRTITNNDGAIVALS